MKGGGAIRPTAFIRLAVTAAICLAVSSALFTASGIAHHRAVAHRSRDRGCPVTMLRCPLQLERPHGLIPGLNGDWHAHPEDLPWAALAGARVIRFPLAWATVQPNRANQWNWSPYDAVFARAAALGLSVIVEPYDAPCWAHPQTPNCDPATRPEPPAPAYQPQWQEFIRRLVARYGDITALEVWNEPNFDWFWSGGADPADYTRLLRDAYLASKSVRPEVPVLFGGIAPMEGVGANGYLGFLETAYDSGAAGYFNALAVHPYPMPFTRGDYRERVLGVISKVRALTYRRQGVELPIWVTEIGLPTQGPDSVSEEEQARRLDAIYRLLARVPRLPVVVVHRAFDQPGSTIWENGFGLLRTGDSPKPSFGVIQWDFGFFSRLPNREPGSIAWAP